MPAEVAVIVTGFTEDPALEVASIGIDANGDRVDCAPGGWEDAPTMIGAIRHVAANASILVISLQGRRISSKQLAAGILEASEHGCKVVGMLLNVGVAGATAVLDAVQKAAEAGTLVVAVKGDSNRIGYPSALPQVAGVFPLHDDPAIVPRWLDDGFVAEHPDFEPFKNTFAVTGTIEGIAPILPNSPLPVRSEVLQNRHRQCIGLGFGVGAFLRFSKTNPERSPAEVLEWAKGLHRPR